MKGNPKKTIKLVDIYELRKMELKKLKLKQKRRKMELKYEVEKLAHHKSIFESKHKLYLYIAAIFAFTVVVCFITVNIPNNIVFGDIIKSFFSVIFKTAIKLYSISTYFF